MVMYQAGCYLFRYMNWTKMTLNYLNQLLEVSFVVLNSSINLQE